MGGRNWIHRIGSVAVCTCMCLSFCYASNAASLDEAQQKQQELADSLKKARKKVDSIASSQKDAAAKVEELETELSAVSRQGNELEGQLVSLNDEIEQSQASLEEAQAACEEQYAKMKERIRYMYENSQTRALDLIFSAGNIGELLKTVEYLSQIYDYDREMMTAYTGYQNTIAQKQEELKNEYDQVKVTKAQIADQQEAVSVLLDAKNQEVAKLAGDLTEAEKEEKVYEQEVAAQNEVLAAIQAEIARQAAEEEARRKAAEEAAAQKAAEEAAKKAAEEAAKKAAEEAAKKAAEEAGQTEGVQDPASDEEVVIEDDTVNDSVDDSVEDLDDDEDTEDDDESREDTVTETASASSSGFIWPCPASRKITSEYGSRTAPTEGASTDHKGIDIGAATGSAIVAVQSGTVLSASYSSSGGNMVIINHGKNASGQMVCSVYMHASALYVSAGDKVTQGQKIAAVGSTGYSTGPHLHFAVTVGGSYVNPHGYI